MRDGVIERHGIVRERVDVRRRDILLAVQREMIGAQRIDRDQDHRRAGMLQAELFRIDSRTAELSRNYGRACE